MLALHAGLGVKHTVIIPTMALQERATTLRRAISSARSGNLMQPEIVVVVNGSRFDPLLVQDLQAMPDVRVVQRSEPGSPGAILAGRQSVRTPFFSFLDDDDEYLPGTVDARVAALTLDPATDVVAVNGFRRAGPDDLPALRHLQKVPADPLGALFVENWLPSCGAAFRSNTVPEALFLDLPAHLHWSYLAFQLAMSGRRVSVLDRPGFVIHDTPLSASKSVDYLLCHIDLYKRMLRARPPQPVRGIVARRLAASLHDASEHFRSSGRWREAWLFHMRSLARSGGWRFLSYTRHLVSIHGPASR